MIRAEMNSSFQEYSPYRETTGGKTDGRGGRRGGSQKEPRLSKATRGSRARRKVQKKGGDDRERSSDLVWWIAAQRDLKGGKRVGRSGRIQKPRKQGSHLEMRWGGLGEGVDRISPGGDSYVRQELEK